MKKLIGSLIVLVLALWCIGTVAKFLTRVDTEAPDGWSKPQDSMHSESQENTRPDTQESEETKEQDEVQSETQDDVQTETQENIQSTPVEHGNKYEQMVEQILDNGKLTRTALPVSFDNVSADRGGKLSTLFEDAPGGAFALACAGRAVNPISAYRLLVSKGVFTRTSADSKPLELCLIDGDFASQLCSRKVSVSVPPYSYSDLGCQRLMWDIIKLAGFLGEGTVYDGWLAGSEEEAFAPEIHYSEADGCYYGYFIYYDELGANVLCVYIRSGDGSNITDLEFQMLDLDYYVVEPSAGFSIAVHAERVAEGTRAASMIMAAETLLTGKTKIEVPGGEDAYEWTLKLPTSYKLNKWSVKVYTESYTSEADVEPGLEEMASTGARIINYRIRK